MNAGSWSSGAPLALLAHWVSVYEQALSWRPGESRSQDAGTHPVTQLAISLARPLRSYLHCILLPDE
jgi:hypothetical protein